MYQVLKIAVGKPSYLYFLQNFKASRRCRKRSESTRRTLDFDLPCRIMNITLDPPYKEELEGLRYRSQRWRRRAAVTAPPALAIVSRRPLCRRHARHQHAATAAATPTLLALPLLFRLLLTPADKNVTPTSIRGQRRGRVSREDKRFAGFEATGRGTGESTGVGGPGGRATRVL